MVTSAGIYKITNEVDGKVYIGKTKNFKNRWRQYQYDYENRRSRSLNSYIMNAMLKHGFEKFRFDIVEICDISLCADRELYWMDYYESCDLTKGYNLRRDSSSGMITHPATSEKISNRLKDEWSSGIRSGHSTKMIESWSDKDKSMQSAIMTKALTKYNYLLTDANGISITLSYKKLRELDLHRVLGKFLRKNSNVVEYKGYIIERVLLDESKA